MAKKITSKKILSWGLILGGGYLLLKSGEAQAAGDGGGGGGIAPFLPELGGIVDPPTGGGGNGDRVLSKAERPIFGTFRGLTAEFYPGTAGYSAFTKRPTPISITPSGGVVGKPFWFKPFAGDGTAKVTQKAAAGGGGGHGPGVAEWAASKGVTW